MKRPLFALLLAVSALASCLDDWDVDERKFPCRKPSDCAEGFECHPTRWVCVEAGSVELDAGSLDAGSDPDAG